MRAKEIQGAMILEVITDVLVKEITHFHIILIAIVPEPAEETMRECIAVTMLEEVITTSSREIAMAVGETTETDPKCPSD